MFLLGVETKNGGIEVVGFFVNEYDGNLSGVHLSIYASRATPKRRCGFKCHPRVIG